jgi:hypothetical protein
LFNPCAITVTAACLPGAWPVAPLVDVVADANPVTPLTDDITATISPTLVARRNTRGPNMSFSPSVP